MFLPEFTITTKVLNNIAKMEYARAVVENTPVLQTWQNQLSKDTKTDAIFAGLQTEGINIGYDAVKKHIYGQHTSNLVTELVNFTESFDLACDLAVNKDLQEQDIKHLTKTLLNNITPRTRQNSYRSRSLPERAKPEEVLAEITEFVDWLNTKEAREEHPLIVAALTKFTILSISPIDQYNHWLSSILARLVLISRGYSFKNWINIEDCFYKDVDEIEALTTDIIVNRDYTQVLEYISDQFVDRALDLSEKVRLLAKDTKIAKVSGRAKLTERQENIVAYLQDYGLIQNKDFPTLFPKISEDSVLRDLKALIDAGIIVKSGSTKSSRYELK
jgi:Fic family protein